MPTTAARKQNEEDRIKEYIGKIATGPNQSRDLTEKEAEDALSLILSGAVSMVRAGIFLIAARMKRETLPENIGYWRALDGATVKHLVNLERLLQVADPFDGFNRVPYFGFYAIPVMAAMGLPAYGHSALSLPPKFGITFHDILHRHYQVPLACPMEKVVQNLEQDRFTFVGIHQSHPPLERLRELRVEMIKRTVLSTFEKMLMPLQAKGENYLATGYFHKGYEVPMAAAAGLSQFDKTIIGNGMEGATLYGVHKPARVFVVDKGREPREMRLSVNEMFTDGAARKIGEAYAALKKESVHLDTLSAWGEAALKNASGPAAPLIACQAGTLCQLAGLYPDPQAGFDAAQEILKQGTCYDNLMRFIQRSLNGNP